VSNEDDKIFVMKEMAEAIESRIILLRDELSKEEGIDFYLARYVIFSAHLMEAKDPNKEITLYIDTSGGSVTHGLRIFNTLKAINSPIKGIVVGQASSMGAVILQACDTRLAVRHSHILIHTVSRTKTISLSLLELKNVKKELDVLQEELREAQEIIEDIFLERTGQTKETIKKKCREGKIMTAEEAKEFGLIDDII